MSSTAYDRIIWSETCGGFQRQSLWEHGKRVSCCKTARRDESWRCSRREQTMTAWIQDLRYALRQVRRKPGFAVVAIFTLALGIGANTAIYSLLDQALLRRLPVQDPARLVMMRYFGANTGRVSSYGGDDKNYF